MFVAKESYGRTLTVTRQPKNNHTNFNAMVCLYSKISGNHGYADGSWMIN